MSRKGSTKDGIKSRRFIVLALSLLLPALGLSIAPESVAVVAEIACQVVQCGE